MEINIIPYEETKFDKLGKLVEGTVAVDSVSVTYVQNSDCSGDDEEEEAAA